MKLKSYQDYYLQVSSDTALTMTLVALFMDGIGQSVAWGIVITAVLLFLVRLALLVSGKTRPMESPRWIIYPKMLLATAYGFFFFIRDQWTAGLVCCIFLCLLILAGQQDL